MSMPRLSSDFWVSAFRKQLELLNIPVYVLARGDATAGAVIIKVATLDGQATLYQRDFLPDTGLPDRGTPWVEYLRASETEIDQNLARQRDFDPDLWVIEVEDREGRDFLSYLGENT